MRHRGLVRPSRSATPLLAGARGSGSVYGRPAGGPSCDGPSLEPGGVNPSTVVSQSRTARWSAGSLRARTYRRQAGSGAGLAVPGRGRPRRGVRAVTARSRRSAGAKRGGRRAGRRSLATNAWPVDAATTAAQRPCDARGPGSLTLMAAQTARRRTRASAKSRARAGRADLRPDVQRGECSHGQRSLASVGPQIARARRRRQWTSSTRSNGDRAATRHRRRRAARRPLEARRAWLPIGSTPGGLRSTTAVADGRSSRSDATPVKRGRRRASTALRLRRGSARRAARIGCYHRGLRRR